MTKEQISKLMEEGEFSEPTIGRELVETHISWVIICDRFVYKIKKPVHYSFLNFSTLEKRKYYCEREIELNRRLTDNIYLNVQPVHEAGNHIIIGEATGAIIDYAVMMNKQDRDCQMDRLLLANKVSDADIKKLAEKIARFHEKATIIYDKDVMEIKKEFRDLESEKEFLEANVGKEFSGIIKDAIAVSDAFINANKALLEQRSADGCFRDCHGDLHSRNIFLLPDPQPFDCIEFNDDFRKIDVLNEVAFLCMDLDALNKHDLAESFFKYYKHYFPGAGTQAEFLLFIYYKSYRANVRAKINSLRARSASTEVEKTNALESAKKYINLMDSYIYQLKTSIAGS